MLKFLEPLARARDWEAVMPWLVRIESKASLTKFVELLRSGVRTKPFLVGRAMEVLDELSRDGFDDAKQLLLALQSYARTSDL